MSTTHCPLCHTELLVKDCTPCMECGGDDFELDHYKEHDYKEYELFLGQRLILCDFCDVDFGSYDATYFGFSSNQNIGFETWNFIRDISDKHLRKDKYCPSCNYRLSFLKFVKTCQEENLKRKGNK